MNRKAKWYANEVKAGNGVTIAFGNSTVPGCLTIEARIAFMPQPIGTVWYAWRGLATIETLGSYVQDSFRRLGIRTRLHRELIKAYPKLRAVVTGEGTRDGTPWLKKIGFKRNLDDGWRFEVKP